MNLDWHVHGLDFRHQYVFGGNWYLGLAGLPVTSSQEQSGQAKATEDFGRKGTTPGPAPPSGNHLSFRGNNMHFARGVVQIWVLRGERPSMVGS
jgi:hypothetical protein